MEKKSCFIYALIDPIENSVRYIGKTTNLRGRYLSHINVNKKSNFKKTNWIKSLFKKNLKPEMIVLDEVEESEWCFWEKHYISLYKSLGFSLLNATDGGEGTSAISDETKEKISASNSGKKRSLIAKERMSFSQKLRFKNQSVWNKGVKNPYSEETVLKIKNSLAGKPSPRKGVILSEETKNKISLSLSNGASFWTNKPNPKRRKIVQIDSVSKNFIKIWETIFYLKEEFGFNRSPINKACKLKKTSYGYIWRFYDDLSNEEITLNKLLS